jgi:cell division protein FtsW
MNAQALPLDRAQPGPASDSLLIGAALTLIGAGLVMVTSSSVNAADSSLGQPLHFLLRQAFALALGAALGFIAYRIPLAFWERHGQHCLALAALLLVVVLIPGIGHVVNGSRRWLPLGVFNVQVSEPAKLLAILYLGGYLLRHADTVRAHWRGFLLPLGGVGVLAVLMLLEPDFGAAFVLMFITLGLLFLAGVRLRRFFTVTGGLAALAAVLAVAAPYRLRRMISFINPWDDPFDSDFQLSQALIAFGRGEWFGTGLGGSIQKLFYLPEAHTDFVFAVLAEELGLIGVLTLMMLYAVLVWRIFAIGRGAQRAGLAYGAYVAWGVGLWFGIQACFNMGVNMGVLPTKGLTLPFLSYGGSSLMVMCIALALVLRVDRDTRMAAGRRA